MNAFAFTAGIGIMDKDRLIDGFQIIHQDMMHYPILELARMIERIISLLRLRSSVPRVYLW